MLKSVWTYPRATMDSKVCEFRKVNGSNIFIKGDHARDWLKQIVDLIGEDILGSKPDSIGLHSIRSWGEMAVFLSKTSIIIMIQVGR